MSGDIPILNVIVDKALAYRPARKNKKPAKLTKSAIKKKTTRKKP